MENRIYLSVIIPAYNEEKRLPKTLEEIVKYLNNQSYESEIIVVDSGSKDRTREIVKEKQKEIAEGPAREFGTLNARKTELQAKINKHNEDIARVIEEAKMAGQPSDCIKR